MMRQINDYEFDDSYPEDVTCGSACGHYDYLNQCCWLSWHNKQEGDWCNYDLKELDGEIYTPKELEALKSSTEEATSDE